MTMAEFAYSAHPSLVIFGHGTLRHLPEAVERLGGRRALVLTTPQQQAQGDGLAQQLGKLSAGLCPLAMMHTPVEVTNKAADVVAASRADLLVSLGGGSTTGLGKALALRTGLPHLSIPTTYAGSEMTPILGQTENGVKITLRDPRVLPSCVIYDVDLTLGLPLPLTITSGFNAIAHAVEALYAVDGNPIITLLARESIKALVRALPELKHDPQATSARRDALYGAWLAGICLGSVSMSMHHKLCHSLGGSFDLPHAETHTVLLPHVIGYIGDAAPAAMCALCQDLGTSNPALALRAMAKSLGAPTSLAQIGMPKAGLERAAALACQSPYPAPRALEPKAIQVLLGQAWSGSAPLWNACTTSDRP